MKYTQIPATTFQQIQLNAGVLCTGFNPATGAVTGLLGATTGGITFNAAPTYSDYGDDIDNCPKNTLELKKLDSVEASLAGTFVTIDAAGAKKLIGAADMASDTKIVPRKDIATSDFSDIWWVGDYSDVNTGNNAGYCAIHLLNALNTGGFQIKSTDKGKGNFAFTFTGHFSMSSQDTVPYEVYIQAGSGSATPSITLNKHVLNLVAGSNETLTASILNSTQTASWSSGSDSVATVNSSGKVTAAAAGNTIITVSITDSGVTYNDTCTVIVTAASNG